MPRFEGSAVRREDLKTPVMINLCRMNEGRVFKILLVVGLLYEATVCLAVGEDTVEVSLNQGAIFANRVDLEDGNYYYVFKSIPYAEPPVGNLRFKDPVPASPWEGVRNGSMPTVQCAQIDFAGIFQGKVITVGEEDCLFLDVYTPKPYAADLPVMVWIHGGGFNQGSNEGNIPTALLNRDVVVVNIQYRLGTLGFLSTEDSVIPGNSGLKDQVLALRWVQENIRNLGGDPDKVTIFGESAGAISVHYHMLSPMSKGLFRRAIAQSGTAIMPGFTRNDHREIAIAVGRMLECPDVNKTALDSQALYDCLKDVSKDKLVALANDFTEYGWAPQVMVPSVDGEFLPDNPATLLREGKYHKVDFMTGITRDEGCITVRGMYIDKKNVDELEQNFNIAGPILANLENDEESRVYLAKRMFYHHLGGLNITEENADVATKMFGDLFFAAPMDMSAQMHARDSSYGKNLFLYELHHLGAWSFLASPNDTFGKDWICHADDIQYLFDSPYIVGEKRDQDKFMSDIMATLWTNFAATGNPTPNLSLGFKWSPVTSSADLQYLILKTSPYMRGFVRQNELEFWSNLPTKQNKLFYPERFA